MESYAYAIVAFKEESPRRVMLGLNTVAFVVFYCLTVALEDVKGWVGLAKGGSTSREM